MKLFVLEDAENDVLRQVQWYAEQGLPEIARRFQRATVAAIDGLLSKPSAGSPKRLSNPQLNGLRSWPVKDFENWRVYYLANADLLTVVRILHGKRDIRAVLENQSGNKPR